MDTSSPLKREINNDNNNHHDGMEKSLIEPICIATILVSFAPYISCHYFIITLVALLAIFIMLYAYHMYINKMCLQHQFIIRREGISGGGNKIILRNKGIHVPGKSKDDLFKFQGGKISNKNYASNAGDVDKLNIDTSSDNKVYNCTIKKIRISRWRGHRILKTFV